MIEANGRKAFRRGNWVYIPAYPGVKAIKENVNIETGGDSIPQLFNIKTISNSNLI